MKPRPASRFVAFAAVGLWFVEAAEPWTLERVLGYALAHNPDARIAEHRVRAARAVVGQANAAFWPKVQLQSSYLRTDNPMLAFGAILNQRSVSSALDYNNLPETDNLALRGLVTVPLYTGGQLSAGREEARAGQRAAQADADTVRQTLAFEVARTFHTSHKTSQFIAATTAAVRSFETNALLARRRFEAGTLLKADLLDVEVRLAQAREDSVRARNARELAERALRTLLGLETNADFALAITAPDVVPPDAATPIDRPELSALRHQQRAAAAALRGRRAGALPRVSAFGSAEYNYGWETDGDGRNWTAGVMLDWTVWEGHFTRARVAEAQANMDALDEAERKCRLAIDLEVEQARLNLAEADERLAVSEKAEAQATESVDLNRSRFEQGLALTSQLIDAETALTAARVRRAEAEADRRIAVAALRKAFGRPQLDTLAVPAR
jgi:outer membrane protein TolC